MKIVGYDCYEFPELAGLVESKSTAEFTAEITIQKCLNKCPNDHVGEALHFSCHKPC